MRKAVQLLGTNALAMSSKASGLEYVSSAAMCGSTNQGRQDNGADLYKDKTMRLVVVLASFAAVIAVGTPARADPSSNDPGLDARFLAALDNAGITYQNGADAVKVGKTACELMGQGQPEVDVIKNVKAENPGLTSSGAAKFTAIAASAYCPQYLQDQPPPEEQSPAPPSSTWFPPDIPLPPLPAAA